MTFDEAKDLLLETCKSPLAMDIAQITQSLSLWGFKLREYEVLTDPDDPCILQQYMLWLDCSYPLELAKQNVVMWLEGLPEWPWVGQWHFVLYYPCAGKGVFKDWTFEVHKFIGSQGSVRRSDANPRWFSRRRSGKPPEILYANSITRDHQES